MAAMPRPAPASPVVRLYVSFHLSAAKRRRGKMPFASRRPGYARAFFDSAGAPFLGLDPLAPR
jgi:hypothetical protein